MSAAAGLALLATGAMAGNPDRAGGAGATQLLVNPWARSNGWSLANTAYFARRRKPFRQRGRLGTCPHKTEILFSSTRWMEGSGVKINSVGFGQKAGRKRCDRYQRHYVFGFGDLPVTTIDQPEGGLGTFSPTQANIGVAYSKAFSNSIFGGLLLRVVSESIANVRALLAWLSMPVSNT
jgi:hypothetical protein